MPAPSHAIPEQLLSQQDLMAVLDDGHVLITANNRLARLMTQKFQQWKQAQGASSWNAATIFTWEAWVSQLWEEAALRQQVRGMIPSHRQQLLCWESVLEASELVSPALHVSSLAAELFETRKLISQWKLNTQHPQWRHSDNENHRAFVSWLDAFDSFFAEKNWVPFEDRETMLAAASLQECIDTRCGIYLLGFDEITPQQHELLDRCSVEGLSIHRARFTQGLGKATLWPASDERGEVAAMACWARHHLKTDPDVQLGIVVPDLESRRRDIEKQLRATLTPGSGEGDGQGDGVWNISLGEPLDQHPVVRAGFTILELLNYRFSIHSAGELLRSPWISGGTAERHQRALLEKCLRRYYPEHINLSEFIYRASERITKDANGEDIPESFQEPQPWNSPRLRGCLVSLSKFGKQQRKPSSWAQDINALLGDVGWPLSAQRDDLWQVINSWKDALGELASLDLLLPKIPWHTAVSRLREICAQTVFQPASPPARAQVLGLYESSALRFDHLWVMGLDHRNWPPTSQPNPFIPIQLQSEAGLPRSTAERELKVATTVTARLLDCADQVIFSYPSQVDGEDNLSSPLFGNMTTVERMDIPGIDHQNWRTMIFSSATTQPMPLELAGPVGINAPSGGSSILKNQALCPFRAFATNRLLAEPLDTPAVGISPAQHGSLLHLVLEKFWNETGSHEALCALPETALEDRVEHHIGRVLDDDRSLTFRQTFKAAEFNRLKRHVLAFLMLEKEREPFEVLSHEKELTFEIQGQPIHLFIDRIDRTIDDDQVIIDYKSGKVTPSHWLSDRPRDPQLPLYAVSTNETPAAIVFAVVREDGCAYKGVAQKESLFPGLSESNRRNRELVAAGENLPATIQHWREVLDGLMDGFLEGDARLDPRDGVRTCQNSYCQMQSLCRINEWAIPDDQIQESGE